MSNEKFETMLKNVSVSELEILDTKMSLLSSIADYKSIIKQKYSFDGISDLVNSIYSKTPVIDRNPTKQRLGETEVTPLSEPECDCEGCVPIEQPNEQKLNDYMNKIKNVLSEYDTEDECTDQFNDDCNCQCCTRMEKDVNDQSDYYMGCDIASGDSRSAYYIDLSNLDIKDIGKILGDIKKSEEPKKDETKDDVKIKFSELNNDIDVTNLVKLWQDKINNETKEMSLVDFIKNVADSCDATLSEISEFIKFKNGDK